MNMFQIPFAALFTGMVLTFAAVLIVGTISDARSD